MFHGKINYYTVDDVTLADADDYKGYLKEAKDAYKKVREDLDILIGELDPNTEQEKITKLEDTMLELTKAIKQNEKEVKVKMTEIIDQAAANKP